MEDLPKTTQSISQPDVSRPRHQATADPPKDVDDEVMAHFNDPNWDFEANSSTLSISNDDVEDRQRSKSFNRKDASTEADTEFELSSWHIHDPKAIYSAEATRA